MMYRLAIISLLVVSVVTVPLRPSDDRCAARCTDNSKFRYDEGKTYEYTYRSEVRTMINGTSADNSGVLITANVRMEVLAKCELSMRLSDVAMTQREVPLSKAIMKEFTTYMEKNPTRFAFQDGLVEALCLPEDEPLWVVNVKRAILSVFQNTMEDLEKNHTISESDVAGECVTHYSPQQNSGWFHPSGPITVTKTKEMSGCTSRHGYNSAVQGVPYSSLSDIQYLPILRSNHECEHKIDSRGGYLLSAECHEAHVFRPFSNGANGIVTTTNQYLNFVKVIRSTQSPAATTVKKPITFEHGNDAKTLESNRKDITRRLQEFCQSSQNGVRPDTPHIFTELVYRLRTLDYNTINDIYRLLKDGTFCKGNKDRTRKFFLDALPMAGTAASLNMMTDLITKKVITGTEADMWITSLAFIKYPTQEMLKEVKPLINMAEVESKALLSVGTLVHNYCYYHGNCERDSMVSAIVSAFENKVARGCKVNKDNLKTTLFALRGLGNIGYIERALPSIYQCMRISSLPIEVRLSAIEAFRRVPCQGERKQLVKLFTDVEVDSEIRIAAYKALMECPSEGILKLVISTLEREPIKQVGSYIWSHLTNIQETSDPHRQELRASLEKVTLNKQFDLEKMKYSRNYEGSLFVEKLNTGAKLEGDAIWSSQSFIPRSGMVNLTVDLFGQSVNLFELGSRVEGLEYFLEKFFGPNGYFGDGEQSKNSEIALRNGNKNMLGRMNKFNAKMADLRGSMYMRVFGNELRYTNFEGLDDLLSGGPDFNILDFMIQLTKEKEYSFSHSTMFLDSSIIIPTGAGFPLNLTVNGTANVDLRLKGKMDVSNPPTVDIVGLIQPSAAVSVSSIMSVDTFATKTGVKMVSTLHTNTAFEGKMNMNEAGVLSASYDMPRDKMEIIDFKSSFFNINNNVEEEQTTSKVSQNRKVSCTPEKLTTILGVEMCAELSYPDTNKTSLLPMAGPVSGGIYLYNRDTHTQYILKAHSTHTQKQNVLRLEIDTPKSRVDRHIAVDVSINKANINMEMSLKSPWTSVNMKGKIVNTKAMKALTGEINLDGRKKYDVNAQLAFARDGNAYKYTPSLDISLDKMSAPISMRGMVKYNALRQVDLELSLSGITDDTQSTKVGFISRPNLLSLQGEVSLQKGKTYSLTMKTSTVSTSKMISMIPMLSVRTPERELIAIGGSMKYNYGKKLDYKLEVDKIVAKKVSMKGTVVRIEKKRNRVLHRIKFDLDTSVFDTRMTLKLDNRNFRTVTADLDLLYVIPKVMRDNVVVAAKIINLSSNSLTKGRGNVNINLKRRPHLNTKIVTNLEHNKKLTNLDIDVSYGPNFKDASKRVDVEFSMNRNFKSISDATATLNTRLNIPALDINTMVKGSHKHTLKQLDTNVEVRIGKANTVRSILRLRDETRKLLKLSGEYNLNINGRAIVFNQTVEQKSDNSYLSTIDTQFQKGKKNSIITSIGPRAGKSASGLLVSSNIRLQDMTPFKLEGELDFQPDDFISRVAYEKLSKRYEAILASKTSATVTDLTVNIRHPDRNVRLAMDVEDKGGKYSVDGDLKWNAGKDNSQALRILAWLEHPTNSKLNGSMTLKYPSRTIKLNAHGISSAKNTGHFDIQWAKDQVINCDLSFHTVKTKQFSSVSLSTPFQILPKFGVDLKHDDGKDEYLTNLDVSWNAGQTASLDLNLKKPFNLRTFVGSAELRSSLKLVKRARIEVDHKHSEPLKSITTSSKIIYNRDTVKIDLHLQNKTRGPKVAYVGTMDIQTTMSALKKGNVRLSHSNNGRKFTTIASFLRNKKKYSIENSFNHAGKSAGFENTGKVVVMVPRETYDSDWTINLSANDIRSIMTTSWGRKGKNSVSLKMNGQVRDGISGSINLETPFKGLETASLEMMMKNTSHNFESRIVAQSNKKQHLFGEITASSHESDMEAAAYLKVPVAGLDASLAGNLSNPVSGTFNANMKLKLSPELVFTITRDIVIEKNDQHDIITFASTVPGYERIVYTNMMGAQSYIMKLEYADDKTIELQTRLIVESKQSLVSLLLKTPYQQLPRFETEVAFNGGQHNMKIDTYAEMIPYLPKTTASGQLTISDQRLALSLDMDRLKGEAVRISFNIDGTISADGPGTDANLIVKGEYLENKVVAKVSGNTRTNQYVLETSSPVGSLNIQQSGILSPFSNSASLTTAAGRTYYIRSSFSNADSTLASMTIIIPGKRDISVMISHKGSCLDFTSHAEMTHNRKNAFYFDATSSTTQDLAMSLKTTLTTEILPISDNDFEADLSFNGRLSKFDSRAEFNSKETGTTELISSFDATSDIDGSFVFKSKVAKNIKLSFNHHFKNNYWQCKGQLVRGGVNIIDILGSVNAENTLRGEMNLCTMWSRDFSLVTSADGKITNFNIHTQTSYGVKKANLDITSQTEKSFSKQTLNIQATDMKDIYGEITHTGLPSNIQALAKLNVGKDKHHVEASFKNGMSVEGSLALSSPLIIPVTVSFTHTGKLQNFQSQGQIAIADNKTEVSVRVMTIPALEGSLSLSSPYGLEFNGKFSLVEKRKKTSSQASLTVNRKNIVDVSTTFINDKSVSGSISLSSAYMSTVKASFHHEGPLSDMQNQLSFTVGSLPTTSIEMDLQTVKKFKGILSIENLMDVPNVQIRLEHSGVINNFLSSAEVKVETDEQWVSKATLNAQILDNVGMSFSLETPYSKPLTMNFRHSGVMTKFTTHGDIQIGNDKSEADVSSEIHLPNIETSVSIKSTLIDPVSMNFRHNGDMSRFTTSADIELGNEKSEAEISSTVLRSNIETSIKIKSPFTDDIRGKFTSNGPFNALTTQGEINVGGIIHRANVNINHAGNTLTSKITVNSRHTDDIEINFRHDGDMSSFVTHGDMSIGKVFSEFDVQLNIPRNTVLLSLKSPKVSSKFTHNGDIRNFNTVLELKNVYLAEVKLSTNKLVEASINLKSPIKGYRTVSALYTHAGKPTNFQCHAEWSVEDAKSVADLNVDVSNLEDVKFSFEGKSPQSEMKGRILQSFTKTSYNAISDLTVDGNTIYSSSALLSVVPAKQEGKLELKTESGKLYLIQATSEQRPNRDRINFEATFGSSDNKAIASLILKSNQIDWQMNINLDKLENIRSSLLIDRSPMKYEGHADFNIGRHGLTVRHSLDLMDKIETVLGVNVKSSQYTSQGDFSFQLTPEGADVKLTLVNNTQEIFSATTKVKNADKLTGSMKLTSSVPHPLSLSAEVSATDIVNFETITTLMHKGQTLISSNNKLNFAKSPLNMEAVFRLNEMKLETGLATSGNGFKSSIDLDISKKIWSADMSFEHNYPKLITTSITVRRPDAAPVRSSVSFKKLPYKILANVVFSSEGKYMLDLELKKRQQIEGKISVSSPIENFRSVVLDFEHKGTFPNIQSNADLTYGTNKHVMASVMLKHSDTSEGRITFNSPFERLEVFDVSFYKKSSMNKLQTGGRIQYTVGEEISLDIDHSVFATTSMSEARLVSPFTDEITLGFNHTHSSTNIASEFLLAQGEDNKLQSSMSLKHGQNFLSFDAEGEAFLSGEPFTTKISLLHEGPLENFKTSLSAEAMKNVIEVNADFKLSPVITSSVEIKTPFNNFNEMYMSINHNVNENGFFSTGEVHYDTNVIKGKVDFLNIGLKRIVATAELTTPFEGYKLNRLSYQHIGDRNSFQCDTEVNVLANKLTGMVKGTKSPLSLSLSLKTPFEGLKNIGLNGDFTNMNGDIATRGNAYWANDKSITLEATYSPSPNKLEGSASLSTPFSYIEDARAEFSIQKTGRSFLQNVKVSHNSRTLLDVDVDASIQKQPMTLKAIVNIRKPVPAKFEGNGFITNERAQSKMSMNWNNGESVKMEAGYDLNDRNINFLLTNQSHIITLKGFAREGDSSALLTWGLGPQHRIGYDLSYHTESGKVKVILPSRSLEIEAARRHNTVDGALSWDADRDINQKVKFNLKNTKNYRVSRSTVSLAFPSLTKKIEVESEMMMDRGQVIFGGKTEISLSNDPSKTFVVASQLKDVSSGSLKNYSFSLEMSHPYTTLGVKLGSYFGHKPQSCSAGVNLEYMTYNRRMETFRINGDINKLRKTMNLEVQSPLKSVHISGSAQTDDIYRLSLRNMYDNNQPLDTEFTVDPASRTVKLSIDYDIDTPQKALVMEAGYHNSSAMIAEVYHLIRRTKIPDAKMTLHLSTPHLLTSSVFWRPVMFQELKNYQEKKLIDYSNRMYQLNDDVAEAVNTEIRQKTRLALQLAEGIISRENHYAIRSAIDRQFSPYVRKMTQVRNTYPAISNREIPVYSSFADMHLKHYLQGKSTALLEILFATRMNLPSAMSFVMNQTQAHPSFLKLLHINRYLDLSDHIEHALTMIEEAMVEELESLRDTLLPTFDARVVEYSPEAAQIEMSMRSPIPLVSLDVMPVVNVEKYVQKVVAYLETQDKKESSPKTTSDGWLPPFTGIASIEKGRKITTFDGFVYDLDDDCSYVLARDFVDGNFTLVLTNSDRTMLTLQHASMTFEITLGEEILLNDQPISIPYYNSSIMLTMETADIVKIQLPNNHMSIIYDMSVDHIELKLNGWYFGKTAGLLGTFDNEPSNDQMTPYNKVIDNTTRFSRLWKVENC